MKKMKTFKIPKNSIEYDAFRVIIKNQIRFFTHFIGPGHINSSDYRAPSIFIGTFGYTPSERHIIKIVGKDRQKIFDLSELL